jgi:hypothetical protein
MPREQAPKCSKNDEHSTPHPQRRSDGLTVRAYLEGLRIVASPGGGQCRRGSIERHLAAIDLELTMADPGRHVQLSEQRRELQVELERIGQPVDIDALEAAFVEIAKDYSDHHEFSYQSWREVGVPAAVLARVGIDPIP